MIPHAKQGGKGVRAFAVAGSKFEGTGFENVHIGHIHVALVVGAGAGDGVNARIGLPRLSGGVDDGLCGALPDSDVRFDGLGYKVTFAEDLRKPA